MSESEVIAQLLSFCSHPFSNRSSLTVCMNVCATEKRHKKISHKCWDAILDHSSPLKPVAAGKYSSKMFTLDCRGKRQCFKKNRKLTIELCFPDSARGQLLQQQQSLEIEKSTRFSH